MSKKTASDTAIKIVLSLIGVKMIVYSIALPVEYGVLVVLGGLSCLVLAVIK